jgi:hypothetical protein
VKLFQEMDLYKGIVLAALVLLPAAGFWVWTLDKQIQKTRAAANEAVRPDGLLERIGTLQMKINNVVANTSSDGVEQANTYFAGQIMITSGGVGLSENSFKFLPVRTDPVKLSETQSATDHIVAIEFQRDLILTRDFVQAMLFNCESGARGSGASQARARQSIWKLRKFQMTNAGDGAKDFDAKNTPPPELQDKWIVRSLEFARREPRRDARRG